MQDQDNAEICDFVEGLFRTLATLSIIEDVFLCNGDDNFQERLEEHLSNFDSHLPHVEQFPIRHAFLYPDADRVTWTYFDSALHHCQKWRSKTKTNLSLDEVRSYTTIENFEDWKYSMRQAVKLRVREEFPNSPASEMQRIIDQVSLRAGISEDVHHVRLGVTSSSHIKDIKEEDFELMEGIREALTEHGEVAKFLDIANFVREEKNISVSNEKLHAALDRLRSTSEYRAPRRKRKSEFQDQSE